MSANICNICGANLIYKDGKWVCPACGAFKTEEISNEEVTLLYNAAQKLRLASFDDAEEAYRDIIAKYPENSEAHWGLVLSKYGIKYEDDYDGKKLPTCYATSIESVLTDKDYLNAVRLCKDKYQKEYYIEQGKVLEKIRVEWLEKASKEPKYDVFLCFKDSDKLNNMERTDDSIEVANLYTHLSSLGYKVFYSRESLRDKVAEKYEPYIYNALNTAAVMIVYGSKIEYFSSVWMKNEWTRYVRRLREGIKIEGSLVIACDGVNPGDLPRPLNQMQVLDARKKTFYGDLEAHIAKIISIARRPKATVERVEISSAIGKKKASIDNQIKTIKVGGGVGKKPPVVIDNAVSVREIGRYEVPALTPDEDTKLKSIAQFLRSGLFDPANKVADELLKKNRYNGQALLAKLLVEYSAKSIDELSEKINDINDFSIIHSVIEYNDKEIGEKVIGIICSKIEVAIQNGDYNKVVSFVKEITEYNSNNVTTTRATLRNKAAELLKTNPDESDKIFALLLSTYSDANTYVSYLQGMVDDCLRVKNVALAKKYNDKILELDDGDIAATFNAVYLSVSACNIKEFIGLIDLYGDFSKLDNAIRHFDTEEIVICFYTLQQIFFGALRSGKSGETLSKWFDFIIKYEFDTRKDFIEKTLNELADVKSLQSRAKLFDYVINCIDGSNVDRHIELRLSLADKLRIGGEFPLAEKYYNEVIDIEEGNCNALWGILLCKLKANRESDISEKIDNFTYFSELEVILKYCSDEKTRVDYLDKLSAAVIMKSANLTDKTNIEKLSKVFDGIIKYYPEEFNGSLINYIQKFADNCKNSSAFSLAEKYYAMVLSIDNMRHSAYWGLLQAKLNCRNNDDLIKQNKIITEFTEFSSAIAASSGDERSAERYCQIAKNQLDYIEKQNIIAKQKKKRKSLIKKLSAVVAVMVAIVVGTVAIVGYINSESVLKFSSNLTGVSVYAGKYYNATVAEIPAMSDGASVTEIAKNAFLNKTSIKKIILPATITKIGDNAFNGMSALESINIPDGVTSIGDGAFKGCKSLKTIVIPAKTKRVGSEVFSGCDSLETITIVTREDDINDFAEDWQIGLPSSTNIKGGCVINLDYNGATSEIDTSKQVIGINENYTLPAPQRNGYKFLGWYDSLENGNRLTDENGRSVSVYQKQRFIIAYAYWEANLNSVIFDANGGNGTMQNQQIATDSSANLSECAFTKVGYTFIGWGTTATQKTYDDRAVYAMGTNSTYRLYAIWQANVNTLRFNANGGDGAMSDMNIKTDETKTLTACGFSRKGYDFAGWATLENGTKAYSDKANYLMGADSEYTLYALWSPINYTITYNLNGGSVSSANRTEYTVESKTFTLNNPTRLGYAFNGWFGTNITDNTNTVTVNTGTIGNLSFSADWQIIVYNINYELNGGINNDQNPDTYTVEDNIELKPATRRGYTFASWTETDVTENGNIGCKTFTAEFTADVKLSDDGTTVIGLQNQVEDLVILSEYNGIKVTSIGNYAFDKCSNLTSVTIENGVTSIGSSAFCNCSSLTNITIPNSVTSIGSYAFSNCRSLTSITIPNSVTHIGNRAFMYCRSLTSITIPDSVTSIGEFAFYDCRSLTSITIPDSVTSIGNNAFSGCSSLTGVYITDIAAWCKISFSLDSSNPLRYAHNLYLNGVLITKLEIPSRVTSIGDYAFFACSKLTSITIPSSVTSIGDYVFDGCSSLTSITIPDSVTSIGEYAFYYCSSLTSVTIGSSVTSIGSNAFSGCPIETATMPTTVISSIPKTKLKTVIITTGESIGNSAFSGCSSLTSITIPNSVTSIESYAFAYCSNLTSITIPDSVTSIGSYAFYDCRSLTSIAIPSSVISIGDYAFSGCCGLTNITIPSSVTSIGSSAFGVCRSLTSITIPNSVTSIGDYTFFDCRSLTSITIPSSVTRIGEFAFYDCSGLTSITIPSSVTRVGEFAFYGCGSLTNITVDENNKNYKSIDGNLYTKDGTTLIQYAIGKTVMSFEIPDSVAGIGEYAFSDCTSLTSITIPNSVTSIGWGAFSGCSSLTNIMVDENNKSYKSIDGNLYTKDGTRLIQYAIGKTVTSFEMPDSVASIGKHAFYGCSSLTSITIPNSVTSIDEYAFRNCSGLMSITIPNSVTSIGRGAFAYCSNLKFIYCMVSDVPSGWSFWWKDDCSATVKYGYTE